MARFILIDNSICGIGGHYHEYAAHVLEAAKRAGFTPCLATNRELSSPGEYGCVVYPVYKYRFFSLLPPFRLPGWIAAIPVLLDRLRFRLIWSARFSTFGLAAQLRNGLASFIQHPSDSQSPLVTAGMIAVALTFKILRPLLAAVLAVVLLPVLLVKVILMGLRRVARIRHVRLLYAITVGEIAQAFRLFGAVLEQRNQFLRIIQAIVCRKQFAKDSVRLFQMLRLEPGDVVFVPSTSEVEMMGLAAALLAIPQTREATFHLLFRRDLYRGRERDYSAQDLKLHNLRRCFRKFLDLTRATHRVFFYTDTSELSDQYNRLASGVFRTAPIPHTWPPLRIPERSGPLRLLYLGDSRREKGYHYLPHLALDLTHERFAGRAEFILQSNFNIKGGEPESVVARSQLDVIRPGVVLLPSALTSEEYADYVRSADIILLLYDEENYYARSSGILVEALGAGVPVVAPAATWMSRQFLPELCRRQSEGLALSKRLASHSGSAIRWRTFVHPKPERGHAAATSELDGKPYCRLQVPAGSTHLRITGPSRSEGPSEIRVHVDQLNDAGQSLAPIRALIAEADPSTRSAILLRRIARGASSLVLTLEPWPSEAFLHQEFTIDFLEIDAATPIGAVGAQYHHPAEITDAVRELIAHHEHYRRTALAFSEQWRSYHNADTLFAELLAAAGQTSERPAVQRAIG
ncbi:MAG: hypothetical protein ACRD8O_13285 [Bryobacteraceae bacterium]